MHNDVQPPYVYPSFYGQRPQMQADLNIYEGYGGFNQFGPQNSMGRPTHEDSESDESMVETASGKRGRNSKASKSKAKSRSSSKTRMRKCNGSRVNVTRCLPECKNGKRSKKTGLCPKKTKKRKQ